MVLSVVHHNLHYWRTLAILIATGLILEGVGTTQRIVHLAKLAVQLSSQRGEMELGIIAAGE